MKAKDNNLLPSIESKSFKKLYFKDQLKIVSLYLTNPDKYRELIGEPDPSLAYVDDNINFIRSEPNVDIPEEVDPAPISFVRDRWAAYSSYYKDTWYEESFSPLDDFGIRHRRVFSLQLFNFSLLSLDHAATKILRWLLKQDPRKTNYGRDTFYYVVKLRAAMDENSDFRTKQGLLDIWNDSIDMFKMVVTPEDINKKTNVLDEDQELMDMLVDEDMVLLGSMPRKGHGRFYVPIIPAALYLQPQFYVKTWEFLTS